MTMAREHPFIPPRSAGPPQWRMGDVLRNAGAGEHPDGPGRHRRVPPPRARRQR